MKPFEFLDKEGLANLVKKLMEYIATTSQPKLPQGDEGQILSKTSDGVEWINDDNKWTYL